MSPASPGRRLARLSRALARDAASLDYGPPITHVYNPVEYAWRPHALYLERYARADCGVLLLGMNPGPFGMAQTGVPFGEVEIARDWLGLEAPVGTPAHVHPKRPVEGFACTRSEVSGRRLWGWARETFDTPEAFFERAFVWNWCPLAFLEESGRNRTPDKLPAAERDALTALCDAALVRVVELLRPRALLGVGVFAETAARRALGDRDLEIGRILHPSPASPAANRGWASQVDAPLRRWLGLAARSARSRRAP